MQANVLNSFGVTQVLKLTKLQFKNMKSLAVLSPESFGIFKNQPSLLILRWESYTSHQLLNFTSYLFLRSQFLSSLMPSLTNSYANAQNVNMRNISRKPSWQNASFSKRVLVPILSYQNAISAPTLTHFGMNACAATSYPGHFPWERGCLCSRLYFDRQIKANSEMVYSIALFTFHSLVSQAMGFISLWMTSLKVRNKTITRANRVPHMIRRTVRRTPVRQKAKAGQWVPSRILLTKVPAWILAWTAKRHCRVVLGRYTWCNPAFTPIKISLNL